MLAVASRRNSRADTTGSRQAAQRPVAIEGHARFRALSRSVRARAQQTMPAVRSRFDANNRALPKNWEVVGLL